MTVSLESITQLDHDVRHALATGDQSRLDIIGYGEISLVVAVECPQGRFACKRLPRFRDQSAFDRYNEVFERYVTALTDVGVDVLSSELIRAPHDHEVIAYCVQPVLDPTTIGPVIASGPEADSFVAAVVEITADAISPTLGLDAQISNWALADGKPVYLDVTTPLLRDRAGAEQADLEIFLTSLPWLLHAPVRRFLLHDILRTYYDPRQALIDLTGNLLKERLDSAVPAAITEANLHIGPDITASEVDSYYSRDARMWALLQRVRAVDRGWQRHVRRRTYPFLLPPKIER